MLPFFSELFSSTQYSDAFGWSKGWNEEIEKWLVFANSVNSVWYHNNKNRIKDSKQRDELLGEYKALYFIGKVHEGHITQIEPLAITGKKTDFAFEDKIQSEWFVEVKSPSWRAEVSKEVDNKVMERLQKSIVIIDSAFWPQCIAQINCPTCSNPIIYENIIYENESIQNLIKTTQCSNCKKNIWTMSEKERAERKAKRLAMPQMISGEIRSFSDKDAVEDAIRKSVKQFTKGQKNLLIVTPDMFAGIGIGLISSIDKGHSIKQLLKKIDLSNVITCICLLHVELGEVGIKYTDVWIPITDKPLL